MPYWKPIRLQLPCQPVVQLVKQVSCRTPVATALWLLETQVETVKMIAQRFLQNYKSSNQQQQNNIGNGTKLQLERPAYFKINAVETSEYRKGKTPYFHIIKSWEVKKIDNFLCMLEKLQHRQFSWFHRIQVRKFVQDNHRLPSKLS